MAAEKELLIELALKWGPIRPLYKTRRAMPYCKVAWNVIAEEFSASHC